MHIKPNTTQTVRIKLDSRVQSVERKDRDTHVPEGGGNGHEASSNEHVRGPEKTRAEAESNHGARARRDGGSEGRQGNKNDSNTEASTTDGPHSSLPPRVEHGKVVILTLRIRAVVLILSIAYTCCTALRLALAAPGNLQIDLALFFGIGILGSKVNIVSRGFTSGPVSPHASLM